MNRIGIVSVVFCPSATGRPSWVRQPDRRSKRRHLLTRDRGFARTEQPAGVIDQKQVTAQREAFQHSFVAEKVSGTFCAKHPFGPFRQKVPDTFSAPVLNRTEPVRFLQRCRLASRGVPRIAIIRLGWCEVGDSPPRREDRQEIRRSRSSIINQAIDAVHSLLLPFALLASSR